MEEETKNKVPEDNAVLQVMLEELSTYQEVAGQQLTQLLKDVVVIHKLLSQLNQQPVQSTSKGSVEAITINATIEREMRKHLSNTRVASTKTVKEYRILLFPEQDRKLFYKVVFGRWLLYLLLMLALRNGYKFAMHLTDNQKQIQLAKADKSRLSWSWQYVYSHSDKTTKRMMEGAYYKSKSADTALNSR